MTRSYELNLQKRMSATGTSRSERATLDARKFALRVVRKLSGLAQSAREHYSTRERPRGHVEQDVRALSKRAVRIMFVYSDDDLGRDELNLNLGADCANVSDLPGVVLHILNDADHTLTERPARDKFLEYLAEFVTVPVVTAYDNGKRRQVLGADVDCLAGPLSHV
jgi:hypothetical protein